MIRFVIAALLSVACIQDSISQDSIDSSSALARYVAETDTSYSWSVEARYKYRGADVVGIRLHSQSWRGHLWKHQLYVIKPPRVAESGHAVLVVAGGRWRDAYDTQWSDSLPDEVDIFSRIASRLQSIIVVVAQIPYQPLFDRTEDQIIAYTFDQFLETGDSDWPLLLPMVKAVVRAMDAAEAVVHSEWEESIDSFTVVGGSKRGWTTWLVGAIDERVSAIVPIVIDALNMAAHFPYQSEVWGSPSAEIAPYTDRDLHLILGSDAGRDLRSIVDPFSYRSMLVQPKLVVVATNDDYFPVDSLNLYWRELPEPKFVLYLPNDGHSTDDFRRILRGLRFIHQSAAKIIEMPELSWEFQQDSTGLHLSIRSQPRPRRVRTWVASMSSRDFRDATWRSSRVRQRDGVYSSALERPENGHSAFFAELTFGRGRSAYSISTNLCVVSALPDLTDSPGIILQEDICGRWIR